MVPHKEKISLSPGELIHQEDKRISLSPGGLKKYGTPPGDQENLLVSWWIKKSVVPHQEKISWSPGELIHQETKRFSRFPGGVPPFF